MGSVSEDVLRIIAHNRVGMKNYKIALRLCKNPKTPIAIGMNLLPRIMERDLAGTAELQEVCATMTTLADIGAVVAPIVPAFYNKPKTLDDIVNHTVGRMLDLFDIDVGAARRWKTGE